MECLRFEFRSPLIEATITRASLAPRLADAYVTRRTSAPTGQPRGNSTPRIRPRTFRARADQTIPIASGNGEGRKVHALLAERRFLLHGLQDGLKVSRQRVFILVVLIRLSVPRCVLQAKCSLMGPVEHPPHHAAEHEGRQL